MNLRNLSKNDDHNDSTQNENIKQRIKEIQNRMKILEKQIEKVNVSMHNQ